MVSNDVLDAALKYAERGWRVFPVHPKTKRPLLKAAEDGSEGWKEQASIDAAVIRAWWAQWPSAMIGAPMGDHAFVIDYDVGGSHPETGEVFTVDGMRVAIEEHIGVELPATMAVATPSGGLHEYFAAPGGRMPGNARGALPAKATLPVDVRGRGGYVILPPSRRPDGKRYAWAHAGWLVEAPLAIAEAPIALLDCLQESGRFAPAAPAAPKASISERARPRLVAGTSVEADQAVAKYAERALAGERLAVEQAGPGERNNRLNSAAVKLGRLVGAGVLDRAEVQRALEGACAASGLAKDDGMRACRATIASGLKAGIGDPRDIQARLAEVRERAAARAQRADRPRAAGRLAPGPQFPSSRESAPPFGDSGASLPPSQTEGGRPATLARSPGVAVDAIDDEALIACAALDKSDTDNGKRLLAYFGHDLLVMAQSGVPYGDWVVWTGTHWDIESGKPGATRIAQLVGDAMQREADLMTASPAEQAAIDAGAAAAADLKRLAAELPDKVSEWTPDQSERVKTLQAAIDLAKDARTFLSRRKRARRENGVTTKNAGRLNAMLDMTGPHVRRAPDFFNADPLLVATQTHTLRFVKEIDPENPDPDGTRWRWSAMALPCHRREDWNTAVVPVAYDPDAACPKWLANMERFQPDAAARRTVQQFAGIGLTGMPTQRVMYHYGTGGNFKSVFLEVLVRVLGDSFAVGLPSSTISGLSGGENGGGPSPDLARLYGKRMLRVAELPQDQPLKAETIKKLTGGERFPVRTLFKGFFEFQPIAKPHMSGNGLPLFDGSDGGMKRRLLAVEWPVALAIEEQRDFEEVVRELIAEAPGILNWLIAGALDYLQHGLVVAPKIAEFTQSYIDDNDPVGQFDRDCVVADESENCGGVGAREMYQAFCAWCVSNGIKPFYEARFGRIMKKKRARLDGRKHVYTGVRLENVPIVAAGDRGDGVPDPDAYGQVNGTPAAKGPRQAARAPAKPAGDDVVPL